MNTLTCARFLFSLGFALVLPSTIGSSQPEDEYVKPENVLKREAFVLENCRKSPADMIKFVREMHLPAPTSPYAHLYSKSELERQKKLLDCFPRLKVVKFCECRYAQIKTQLTAEMIQNGTWMNREHEIVLQCLEENCR